MEEEKIRLFVGGLASAVSAGDLRERFAPLGNVQSITIPPAKAGPGHRGFAYVDFVPATDASLRKLFSAYNGCKWRGGLLRIEKAKENFSDRLQHEWAIEAASLIADPPPKTVEVVQKSSLTGGGNKGDLEASDLKIFFPRLKKLKNVPLTGLGKHKRSFQRVESSPLELLLTCACQESLRYGSCDCSNINDGTSSLKEDRRCEDDIAKAIEVERQKQLELLNRLFPSDSTCISLDNQQVVELFDVEGKGIREHEGRVGSIDCSSAQTSLATVTEKVKHDQYKHPLLRSEIESIVGKSHDEPFNSKTDLENEELDLEDDPTSAALTRERAKQLELMRRLFPADAPSTSEPEKVVQPEVSKAKKKRKLNASGNGANVDEPVMGGSRDTITDLYVHSQRASAETNTEQQSADHEQERRVAEGIPAFRSEDSVERASETTPNGGDNIGLLATAEDQEGQVLKSISPVLKGVVSEDDSEMVLNVGYDSLSPTIAEEKEKHELKSLSVRANALLEKVSEMTRHISDSSLAQASASGSETPMPKSSQDVALVDVLEDSEMTLNFGDGSLLLSNAEEQEKALVRNFTLAKHYDWTRTDGSSDLEESEELEGSGRSETHSSEEENSPDGSSDSRESDETEESEYEEQSSKEEDDSDGSSDAEEAGRAEYNDSEEHSSEEADESEESESEDHSSEERDASFNTKEYSELIPPTEMTENTMAEALLQRLKGESTVGKQPERSSKWAALADKCQFRAEEIMQPEESNLGRGTEPVARKSKDTDRPSLHEQDFQVDKSKTLSGQQTDADNRQKAEEPPSSDQKLTRAAWKSLVGETGRVVFSLRQLPGLSQPETPVLTPRAPTIEDTYTQVKPSWSFKALNQSHAKSKVTVSTAEKKPVAERSSTEHRMNTAEYSNVPMAFNVFSSDVCPFMKSDDAEKEWLATKSELRTDYRAKQKYAARNVKKLWGKR